MQTTNITANITTNITANIASYKEATGNIQFNMTNDYMFRYILQNNEKVLRGLISSLLHLCPEEIIKIQITNPISMSDTIVGKEFILDINVMLNDDHLINLELQVLNQKNWKDRSLSYLCRNFDKLYHGQNYAEALPVTHIGFLDFTLFRDEPEFYARNMLMNVRTHRIFNDKFTLSVIDLSQITLATEDDRIWELDYWARLFKAKTWEEIKMLAEKSEKIHEALQEAAQAIYMANEDEMVRQRCYAREEAERLERTYLRDIKNLQETRGNLQKENDTLQEENSMLQDENSMLQTENAKKAAYIAELEAKLKNLI